MTVGLAASAILIAAVNVVAPMLSHAAPATEVASPPVVAETGSVSGKFTALSRVKTRGDTSEKDIVVYLKPAKAQEHTPPSAPIEVLQEKLQFKPHVLPVLKGSSLSFKNADTVTHNVFAKDDCCSMDMDMPAGNDGAVKLDKSGVVSVICRLHPEMSMFIVVLDDPWFAHAELKKVKVDGKSTYTCEYSISGVPPGSYTLTFWNKKLKAAEFEITIEAGADTALDIEA